MLVMCITTELTRSSAPRAVLQLQGPRSGVTQSGGFRGPGTWLGVTAMWAGTRAARAYKRQQFGLRPQHHERCHPRLHASRLQLGGAKSPGRKVACPDPLPLPLLPGRECIAFASAIRAKSTVSTQARSSRACGSIAKRPIQADYRTACACRPAPARMSSP
jgi:hypothetical protein